MAQTANCQSEKIKMAPLDFISGRYIAAARALIGMSQADLAKAADLSISTLKRMEATGAAGIPGSLPNNARAVVAALEAAGVVFVQDTGNGPGVALRKD